MVLLDFFRFESSEGDNGYPRKCFLYNQRQVFHKGRESDDYDGYTSYLILEDSRGGPLEIEARFRNLNQIESCGDTIFETAFVERRKPNSRLFLSNLGNQLRLLT